MEQEPHPERLGFGIFLTLLAYIFFVTASSLVWNFQGKFPTIQILCIQNIISLLCILPMTVKKGKTFLKTSHFPTHLVRDLFGVLSYYLYFLAIRHLNLVDATLLNYTAPFYVPLIWRFWMRQKIPSNVWWAIVVGFIGVLVMLNPSKDFFKPGIIYGLFAGLTSGVAFAAVRVLNIQREPTRRTLFYYFSFGVLFTTPLALITWVPPQGIEWLLVIGIGIATAMGQMLLTLAYQYGTASYLSPIGYVTVIYAMMSSYWIFNVPPASRSLLGTLLIVGGGTLTYILRHRPKTIQQVFEKPK